MRIKNFYPVVIGFLVSFSVGAHDCYRLTERIEQPGFFSDFNTVIAALDFIERNNAGLTIDFEKSGLYYDESIGDNWWEYYFEPIHIKDQGIINFKKFAHYQKIMFSLLGQFEIPLERAHELIEKHIKIKRPIQQKIEKFVLNNFYGHYVIGVHYRGTDKVKEAPKVSYHDVYKAIVKAKKEVEYLDVKIFIATDDASFLEYIHQQFPGSVCACEALRSTDGKPVHLTEKVLNYQKGEGALIDCVLLSRTNILLKMSSNLSDCSRQFNPKIPVVRLNSSYDE